MRGRGWAGRERAAWVRWARMAGELAVAAGSDDDRGERSVRDRVAPAQGAHEQARRDRRGPANRLIWRLDKSPEP